MQRNLVLACVITVLITVVWYWLMGDKMMPEQVPSEPQRPTTTEVSQPEKEVERPAAVEKLPATVSEATLQEEAENARDVQVETPFVDATFTTLGARVRSIKLKPYPYRSGGLVDVVPNREKEGELPLRLSLHDDVGSHLPNKLNFAVKQDGYNVTFEKELPNKLFITKEYRFDPDNYDMELTVGIENRGDATVYVGEDEEASYVLWWGPGIEKMESDRYNRILFAAVDKGKFVHTYEDRIKSVETYRELSWLGLKSRYFLVAIVPLSKTPSTGRVLPMGTNELGIELDAKAFRLDPGEREENKYLVYAGPQDMARLSAAGYGLERAVNFGWFDGFSKIMLKILKLSYRVIPNYGVGIIFLTIMVRVAMYPLTRKSMQSMKKMQELQPELAKLREKYKDNPQEMNRRMMQFYKEKGINPMGGCLPMLLQTPIWFALFGMLRGAIELRGAHFFLWIDDLSEPDTIATLPFRLPLLGDEVHVLPLLMAAAMFLQQKLLSPGGAAQSEQQRMMMLIFPVMFGFLFYGMPSGLCLYILVSTLLYFGQQVGTRSERLFRGKEQPAPGK